MRLNLKIKFLTFPHCSMSLKKKNWETPKIAPLEVKKMNFEIQKFLYEIGDWSDKVINKVSAK